MPRILPGLLLALFLAAAPAAPPPAAQPASRTVVIGDLHGEYDRFLDMLRQAALVDARGDWAGGRARLIQLGDVPDRAPDTRKILDHLRRLEPQARRAGGRVHALIGNHEAMNVTGDLRYVVPGEYAAFAGPRSAAARDAYYARYVAALKARPPAAGLPVFDAAFRARFDAERPLGWVEHRQAWAPTGTYGRWIATHDAALRIGDTLYVHGGVGPAYLPYDVETMNAAVIAALKGEPGLAGGPPDILEHPEGPLWYRGFAQNEEAAEAPHLAAVLNKHGVKRIVIGHTKRYFTVTPRFDGAVIMADVAVRPGCTDPHAFLIDEGGTLSVMHRGRKLPFGLKGEALAAFQAQVAALDREACAPPASPPSS